MPGPCGKLQEGKRGLLPQFIRYSITTGSGTYGSCAVLDGFYQDIQFITGSSSECSQLFPRRGKKRVALLTSPF